MGKGEGEGTVAGVALAAACFWVYQKQSCLYRGCRLSCCHCNGIERSFEIREGRRDCKSGDCCRTSEEEGDGGG